MNIRIFIASPSDVQEERNLANEVIDELSWIYGEIFKMSLKCLKWETDVVPDVGEDSQEVINRQIGTYDVFVGVMWKKFGSPTKNSSSGTKEEFERAYSLFIKRRSPKIMFYFGTAGFYPSDEDECNQVKKVLKFKHEVSQKGVLYSEFSEPIDFERKLRKHLSRHILQSLFSDTNDLKFIEVAVDRLSKFEKTPGIISSILYRIGDDRVQEDPDVEDAVCEALVKLGIMKRTGINQMYKIVAQQDPDIQNVLDHLKRRIPLKYFES